jgi:hypothetical protein
MTYFTTSSRNAPDHRRADASEKPPENRDRVALPRTQARQSAEGELRLGEGDRRRLQFEASVEANRRRLQLRIDWAMQDLDGPSAGATRFA